MDVALAFDSHRTFEHERLTLTTERQALERDTAWYREFNVKRALSTIARCVSEVAVLNEHIAFAQRDLDAQTSLAVRQVVRARLEELESKVKWIFAEADRAEADLERWRSFDFPNAVRRLLAIEAREAQLRHALGGPL